MLVALLEIAGLVYIYLFAKLGERNANAPPSGYAKAEAKDEQS